MDGLVTVFGQVSKSHAIEGAWHARHVMHDSWVTEARLDLLNAPTIIPAVVVYYTGTGVPFYDSVRKTAREEMIVKQAQVDHKKPVSEPSTILVPAGSVPTITPSGDKATASLDLAPRQDVIKVAYTCGTEGVWRQLVVEEAPDMKPKACRLFLKISQGLPDHPVRHEEVQRAKRKACAAKAASFINYWTNEDGFTCLALPGARGK